MKMCLIACLAAGAFALPRGQTAEQPMVDAAAQAPRELGAMLADARLEGGERPVGVPTEDVVTLVPWVLTIGGRLL